MTETKAQNLREWMKKPRSASDIAGLIRDGIEDDLNAYMVKTGHSYTAHTLMEQWRDFKISCGVVDKKVKTDVSARTILEQYYIDKYRDKPVKLVQNPGEIYTNLVGKVFTCRNISFTWQGGTLRNPTYELQIEIYDGNMENSFWIYANNVICLEDLDQTSSSITKLKKKEEKPDRYGNKYVIELYQPMEDNPGSVLYISSALRTLLDVDNGDGVSFAIDENKQEFYICKDKDGYQVKDGTVDSNVEWRSLYNTFNEEKTLFNESPKLILNVSHYVTKDTNNPDYQFYLINEPWVKKDQTKENSVKTAGLGYGYTIGRDPLEDVPASFSTESYKTYNSGGFSADYLRKTMEGMLKTPIIEKNSK